MIQQEKQNEHKCEKRISVNLIKHFHLMKGCVNFIRPEKTYQFLHLILFVCKALSHYYHKSHDKILNCQLRASEKLGSAA